jgi:K+-sensing histidine kinase KdpD
MTAAMLARDAARQVRRPSDAEHPDAETPHNGLCAHTCDAPQAGCLRAGAGARMRRIRPHRDSRTTRTRSIAMPCWTPLGRQRYGFAFLAVAIATGCVGVLMVLSAQPIFLLYIVAIAASTTYGGSSAGLVAAALAFFASLYLFIPPYFSLTYEQSILPLLVFYGSTVVLSTLVSWHIARRRGKRTQRTHSTRPWWHHATRRNGHRHPH